MTVAGWAQVAGFLAVLTRADPAAGRLSGGCSAATAYGRPSLFVRGPQGFTEALWAYTSQAFNNGSTFAGYTGFVQPNAPGNVGAFVVLPVATILLVALLTFVPALLLGPVVQGLTPRPLGAFTAS